MKVVRLAIIASLAAIAGCAIFDRSGLELEDAWVSLQSPEMEAAIAAARPGVPREH